MVVDRTYSDYLDILSLHGEVKRGLLVIVLHVCTGTLHHKK
jgi:hypothetical protein